MATYREISNKEADDLVSLGVTVEYRSNAKWLEFDSCIGFLPSDLFLWDFRVEVDE